MAPSEPTHVPGAPPDPLRAHAIELYCREFCGADRMLSAVADAVASISPADAGGGDDQLLRVTRTAAARHIQMGTARECDETPSLLAQSVNGELPPSRQFKLENHLERCLPCRATLVREQRASRAFIAVLATGPAVSKDAGEVSPAEATQPADPPLEAVPPPPPVARRGLAVYPADRRPLVVGARRRRATRPSIAALTAYAPFFITLALGALLIAGVALALSGGHSSQPAASSLPPPAASSTPPAAVGVAASPAVTSPRRPHQAGAGARLATTPTTTPATTSSVATRTAAP